MDNYSNFNAPEVKPKSFWQRPEGVTGAIFMTAIIGGLGYALFLALPTLIVLAQNTIYLVVMLAVLAAILYMIFDPKMRNLVWYGYKSIMRFITGMFVQIDPIGILKSYVDDLKDNLAKMSKQIGNLRGQMRRLQTLMQENDREMENSLKIADLAKRKNDDKNMMLNARKAARLKETNAKYASLTGRMDILYKLLSRMYTNSEIIIADTEDQVRVKEQERKAIRTSHSAMKSAMSVMQGDPDKRAMFDAALENIANDVADKVGEMERFMELSANFMDSVDLQNGVFEEEGLKMLEQYEKQSKIFLLGDGETAGSFDINTRPNRDSAPERQTRNTGDTSYDNLFE